MYTGSFIFNNFTNTCIMKIAPATCNKDIVLDVQCLIQRKCPKILYTKSSDKMACANSVDSDQTAPEQSDQGLHCLPIHQVF